MKKTLAGVSGFLFAVMLSAALLTGIVRVLACSSPVMTVLMTAKAPSEMTGLPETEYPGMAGMITGYLAGTTDNFQYTFTDPDGIVRVCFHDYEQKHMEDCRGLIRLSEVVLTVSLTAAVVFLCAGLLLKRKRTFCRGGLAGAGIVLLTVIAMIVWAVLDFSGFFIRFHMLAFTNELWLLDPQTDLLIRLMPTEFFETYGIAGGGIWLVLMAGTMVLLFLTGKRERHSV